MELPILKRPPPELSRVIQRMADLKIQQDYMARTLLGQEFLNDWMGAANTCAFCPDTFIRRLLPFLFWEEEQNPKKYPALVPVEIAIGACIKGQPAHIAAEDVSKRITQYRENKAPGATASGTYIPALGIYFAHEGKHRVAFMRHHDEPVFQAEIDDLAYPSADRLKIVTPSAPNQLLYAVLDGRYLQVLLLPHSTQRILTSYGVSSVRWSKLENVPSESTVFRAVCDRHLFTSPENRSEAVRTIDLQELLQEEEKESLQKIAKQKQNARWKNRLLKRLLAEPG
jgi:hypothetical protein